MTKYIKPDSVSFLMNVRKRALAEVYRRGVLISENFAFVSTLHLFITQGSQCHKNNFQRSTCKLRPKRLVLSSLHELHVKKYVAQEKYPFVSRIRIRTFTYTTLFPWCCLIISMLIIPCVLGNVQIVSLVARCMSPLLKNVTPQHHFLVR